MFGWHEYASAFFFVFPVQSRVSFLLHIALFAMALDGEQDLPESAGFFVLRQVRGLVEPDELLAFGRLQRPIVLLRSGRWGDVIVSSLQQKRRDTQSRQHLK